MDIYMYKMKRWIRGRSCGRGFKTFLIVIFLPARLDVTAFRDKTKWSQKMCLLCLILTKNTKKAFPIKRNSLSEIGSGPQIFHTHSVYLQNCILNDRCWYTSLSCKSVPILDIAGGNSQPLLKSFLKAEQK